MTIRRLIQATSLSIFFGIILAASYGLIDDLPTKLYLKASPYSAVVLLLQEPIVAVGFLVAAVVLASALLAGRFFCGNICPLGTLMDLVGRAGAGRGGGDPLRRPWATYLRYIVLFGSLSAALTGLSLIGWLDPLAILARSTAVIIGPWVGSAFNLLSEVAGRVLAVLDLRVGFPTAREPAYGLAFVSLLFLGSILALVLWRRRWWCRYVCPLGGMLALAGHIAPFRRRVTEDCTSCMLCVGSCPMGAIGEQGTATLLSECILCGRCQEVCPNDAVRFLPGHSISPVAKEVGGPMLHRREMIAAVAAGLFAGWTTHLQAGFRRGETGPIRPPGAIPEGDFLDTCIRCGICVAVCLTSTLEPCIWESGWEGVWAPKANLRRAPCEPTCVRCGQACPTGAIRELPLEERIEVCMGTAVIYRELCLVWEQDKRCLVCDEVCPYGAIVFKDADGMPRPFVVEERCTGCGQCEHHCPVEGKAAIRVSSRGQIRLKGGSYREEARRRGRRYVMTGSRTGGWPAEDQDQGIPKGFLINEEKASVEPHGAGQAGKTILRRRRK